MLSMWDRGQIRNRIGGMGRFLGGLRGRSWDNNIFIEINKQIIRDNYIQMFLII